MNFPFSRIKHYRVGKLLEIRPDLSIFALNIFLKEINLCDNLSLPNKMKLIDWCSGSKITIQSSMASRGTEPFGKQRASYIIATMLKE